VSFVVSQLEDILKELVPGAAFWMRCSYARAMNIFNQHGPWADIIDGFQL